MQRSGERGVSRHFNYANVMSTLAVFLVIAGGTAIAAQIDGSKLKPGSVKNKAHKTDSIKSNKLKDGRAVANADVIPGTLTSTALADNAVTTSKIANDAVNAAKIGAAQVRASELGPIEVATNTSNIGANAEATFGAPCPDGTRVLSGGATGNNTGVELRASSVELNGWVATFKNNTASVITGTVSAVCLSA